MKKIALIAIIALASVTVVNAQWWFKGNVRYGFVAPTGLSTSQTRTFPASETITKTFNDTLSVTVKAEYTKVVVSDTASSNTLLILDINSQVQVGSKLYVQLKSGTTGRSITLGTGVKGSTVTGTANKTKVAVFEYDGTNYIGISSAQID